VVLWVLEYVGVPSAIAWAWTHRRGADQTLPRKPQVMQHSDEVSETFDEFEDAVGEMEDLANVEVTETTNPGLREQGFTEKWTGRTSDGTWKSAFRNPETGKFTGGHDSSRNFR
jgi:hypothetical protein